MPYKKKTAVRPAGEDADGAPQPKRSRQPVTHRSEPPARRGPEPPARRGRGRGRGRPRTHPNPAPEEIHADEPAILDVHPPRVQLQDELPHANMNNDSVPRPSVITSSSPGGDVPFPRTGPTSRPDPNSVTSSSCGLVENEMRRLLDASLAPGPVWIVGDSIVRWAEAPLSLPLTVMWQGQSGAQLANVGPPLAGERHAGIGTPTQTIINGPPVALQNRRTISGNQRHTTGGPPLQNRQRSTIGNQRLLFPAFVVPNCSQQFFLSL
ncbi:uncharacterized protein LOC119721592 [Patiria miniata]|uniref:Uncharacterized protein n=1 Tax=Patiria miniata TaxID=46514 RepID=A0A913Z7D0_PATMI|nr:uncharacterized protein LOC119721592 [Patiria miniata]